MKSIAFVFAILLAGISHAQVKMSLSVNGQKVGRAVLSQKLTPSGGMEQSVHMMIQAQGASADFSFTSVVDKSGRPISQVSSQSSGAKSKNTTMIYGPKTAKVTKIEDGKASTSTLTIPKGNISDSSDFWFVTTRPKPGTTVTHLHYSDDTSSWKTGVTKYVGDDIIPGTTRTGHHIHHDDGDMWLDDKGLPIRMDMDLGGTRMVFVRE